MNDWHGNSHHYGGYQQGYSTYQGYWQGRESKASSEPPKPQIEMKIKSVTLPAQKPQAPTPTTVESDIMGFGKMTETYTWKEDKVDTVVDWVGPRMDLQTWRMGVAFLRWANDTHKCEAQLRIFSNMKTGETKLWAFTQSIRAGLSTVEFNVLSDEERKQFPEEEGWRYVGTIHSHCNASAGQSGTDHHNELPQDGWHITVGHLDRETIDLHCRLSVGNRFFSFTPWIETLIQLPEAVRASFAGMEEIETKVLIELVKIRPGKDCVFPEAWKLNMKEEPRQTTMIPSTVESALSPPAVWPATIHISYTDDELKRIFPDVRSYHLATTVRNRGLSIEKLVDAWNKLKGVDYKDLSDMHQACERLKVLPAQLHTRLPIGDSLMHTVKKIMTSGVIMDFMEMAYSKGTHPVSLMRDLEDIEDRIDQLEKQAEMAALKGQDIIYYE